MDEMEQLGGVGLSVDRNDQVDFSSLLIGRRLLRDWEVAEFPQSLVKASGSSLPSSFKRIR